MATSIARVARRGDTATRAGASRPRAHDLPGVAASQRTISTSRGGQPDGGAVARTRCPRADRSCSRRSRSARRRAASSRRAGRRLRRARPSATPGSSRRTHRRRRPRARGPAPGTSPIFVTTMIAAVGRARRSSRRPPVCRPARARTARASRGDRRARWCARRATQEIDDLARIADRSRRRRGCARVQCTATTGIAKMI